MRYSKSTIDNQLHQLAKSTGGKVQSLVYAVQDRVMNMDGSDLQEHADQIGLTITTLNDAADGNSDAEDAVECVCHFLRQVGVSDPEGLVDVYLKRRRRVTREELCA